MDEPSERETGTAEDFEAMCRASKAAALAQQASLPPTSPPRNRSLENHNGYQRRKLAQQYPDLPRI